MPANSVITSLPTSTAPASLQPRHHGGVFGGNALAEDFRPAGGADARGVDQVLGAVGNAVQRAAVVPGGNLLFGAAGFTQSEIGADGNERMQFRIERLDAFQGGPGEFDGRDLPPLDQRRDFGDGVKVQQRGDPLAPDYWPIQGVFTQPSE